MHELSLAESAIELIESVARKERFTRVRVVHLEVGALSCVEPGALAFAFQSASLGTCAEGARLNVLHVPGEGVCPSCGATSVMDTLYALCPVCEGAALGVQRGTEMRVKDLDVE